jgi:hypothetical protein
MELIEGALFRFLLGEIVGDGEGQGEVAESGQVGEEVEGLKDEAVVSSVGQLVRLGGGEGFSVDESGAIGRRQKTGEDAEECRLSASRWADEDEVLCGDRREGEASEDGVDSGAEGKVPEFNGHNGRGSRGVWKGERSGG